MSCDPPLASHLQTLRAVLLDPLLGAAAVVHSDALVSATVKHTRNHNVCQNRFLQPSASWYCNQTQNATYTALCSFTHVRLHVSLCAHEAAGGISLTPACLCVAPA